MSLLQGLPTPLPDYGRPDLAFQAITPQPQVPAASTLIYTPAPGYFEVAAIYFVTVGTSAVIGDRTPTIFVQDADANFLYYVPAPGVQPASTTWRYVWLASGNTAFGPVGGFAVSIIPDLVLQPGYVLTAYLPGVKAGDTLQGMLTTLRIPTGPELAAPPPVLRPVPIGTLAAA